MHDPIIDPATVTDSQGRYRFDDVPAGTFYVVPVAPSGWMITSGIYDGVTGGGETTEFTPMSVSDRYTLRGRLFKDADGDGRMYYPSGDRVLARYTVFIDTNDNGTLDADEHRVQTSPSGAFVFPGLELGEHVVRFIPREDDPANSVAGGAITVTLPHPDLRPGRILWVPFPATNP